MPDSFSRPDLTSPASVAETTFSTALRGYRSEEVRLVLRDVAAELARLQAEIAELRQAPPTGRPGDSSTRSDAARIGELDDDTVRKMLGEEMVKVLQTAREAAAEVLERGEQSAAQLIREASTQATALRHEAELEVARLRAEAAAAVQADVDRAREQGREMVAEAQAYRDKLMAEAARRRDAAREQIDRLFEGRERMVKVFEQAQRVSREVLEDLGPSSAPEPYVDLRVGDSGPVPLVPQSAAAPPFDLAVDEDFAAEPEPEPEQEQELQPEPQPESESEPESNVVDLFPVEPAPAQKVDGLFAQLRAETSSSQDQAVQDQAVQDQAVSTSEEPIELAEPEIDDSPFGQREAAVVPLIVGAARKIKRTLADEQNEVLGQMRNAAKISSVEDLIADAVAHTARYVEAITPELLGAYGAGSATSGTQLSAIVASDLDRMTAFVTDGLLEPLRSRLDRAVLDGGGDTDDTIRRVRAVYREWKTQHIDQHLEDVMRLAYGLGILAGVPSGTPMCWQIDPKGVPCADAEDNSLAGQVSAGEAYPTGHTYAPAYPGCRCLVLPAAKIAESS